MGEIFYKVMMVCNNCGWRRRMEIPMGMRVSQFCRTTPCWYCGTHELRREDDDVSHLPIVEQFRRRIKGSS